MWFSFSLSPSKYIMCVCVCVFDLISHKLFFHHPCNPSLEADHTPLCTEHFHSSFCSLLQHRNTFYSPRPASVMGSPLPHPGTPQVPEGHRTWWGAGTGGSANQRTANGDAELFTGSGRRSLLCSASIKGNSAADFLVGVMRPTITQKFA